MHELRGDAEPDLPALLNRLSPVDFVLIEGFKRTMHPKIEVYRAANGKPLLHPGDESVVAVASDTALPGAAIPVLALDDFSALANMVELRATAAGHRPG